MQMKRFNPKDNGVQMPWLDEPFVEKWAEWLRYRAERKLARYVPTGLKKTFTRLKTDSGGDYRIAMEIIDQSMEKNWQGLFPLKTKTNGTNYSGSAGAKPVAQTHHQGGFGVL